MKKVMFIFAIFIILIVSIMLFTNTETVFNYDGYILDAHTNEHDAIIHVRADFNDKNMSEDIIDITYKNHNIIGNIIITESGEQAMFGNIIQLDDERKLHKIVGDITIINETKEVFIELYDDGIKILAPATTKNIANEKLRYFNSLD